MNPINKLGIFLVGILFLGQTVAMPVLAAEINKDLPARPLISKGDKGAAESSSPKYAEGEVIVKFKESAINLRNSSGAVKSSEFAKAKNLEKEKDIPASNLTVLKAKQNGNGGKESVEQMIARLKKDPQVEYVQPNYRYYPLTISTNDTHKDFLWGLDNTGQTVNGTAGTADADIDAPEAWAVNEGTNGTVIVAVIDTGVAYNHPDLAANMWDGSACLDSAGNALGGCNHGYDFAADDKTPLPTDSSHGTHLAGTIGAVKNNAKGIIGVAPNVKIMALKIDFYTDEIVEAINFARYNGAKVINASWGFGATNCTDVYDVATYTAIQNFSGLFVAASGNGSQNHNLSTYFDYPSDYGKTTACWTGLNNVISVAATDSDDNLASFSDYGSAAVDVGAPGVDIYSSYISYSDTEVLFESFDSYASYQIPTGWTASSGSDWGTYDFNDWYWETVLYGDVNYYPYSDWDTFAAYSSITSPTYDLSGSGSAIFSFWTACDTEYDIADWSDYMVLDFSNNGGSSYGDIYPWDEVYLDNLNGDTDPTGISSYYLEIPVGSEYLVSNFNFRLRWITDGDGDYGDGGDGCRVDDIDIVKFSDRDGSDELYQFADGTSMAAPHVVGLAALLEGYNPGLTDSQVKNIILTTGDSLTSLAGKTVTGKRINAYNALQAANPAKAITAFDFTTPAATGVINEGAHTIALTVPYGTNVTALTPTITITGASVSPLSGVAQDFTNPVTYTVTAADSTTQDYIVTVNIELPSTIATVTSATYTVSAGGTANETITNIPYNTSKATFLAALTKGEVNQTWNTAGITDPVVTGNTLVVTAQDGVTVVTYTLTVALNPAKAITAFNFTTPAATGVINESAHTIALTVPYGTNVTALTPTITITGASVSPLSGVAQNFTNPVTYTVTAADSTTQNYLVTVTIGLNPAKAITSFSFASPSASGVINETNHTIAVTLPYGSSRTALVASFATTGVSVKVGSTVQVSGVTVNNFTNPVTYIVTAEDATTQNYVVTVTVALNPAKAITSFKFTSTTPQSIGTITEAAHTIAVTVPYGTNVTSLSPTIAITGVSVNPASGVAQNFTNPVTYKVTAADSTTQDYIVTVSVASPSNIATVTSATYTVSAGGTASETISNIPYGTSKATFLAALTKGQANQTWNSAGLADPVVSGNTLVVTAQNGVTVVTYTLTVKLNPAKLITSFTFASLPAAGVINQSARTISVAVPNGTVVTALVPTIIITGVSVNPASGVAKNFTTPVLYTVTAADATTQTYTVTVTVSAPVTPPAGGGGGGGGGGAGSPNTSTQQPSGLVTVDPTPAGPLPAGVQVGQLVKLATSTAVYFIDQDNRRHAFPDVNTYYSWFPNFNNVQTISPAIMAAIPLGSNVLIRPGTFLIKISSLAPVYAVEPYGVIRWLKTEEVARALYGADWAKRVVDVSDAFFINYQVGLEIASAIHPTGSLIQYSGESSIYYIENGLKRYVEAGIYTANLYQSRFLIAGISSTIVYTSGTAMVALPIEDLMKLR